MRDQGRNGDNHSGVTLPMPACRHRGKIRGDWCECASNRILLGKPGLAPLSLCLRPCPYADQPNREDVSPPPAVVTGGPGTELKRLLGELGLTPVSGCGCDDRAALMDSWGVAGCRERRAEILAWLTDAREKAGWRVTLAAGLRALSGAIEGLDLRDPLGWLVDEAIRRADLRVPTAADDQDHATR